MSLLVLNNVEVVYDSVFLAVKGVSLEVPKAGLVALLGANGAGKSTVLKSISGLLAAERGLVTRGQVTFDGEDMRVLDPPARVRRGLVHVLEGRHVFGHLTPEENLIAATSMHPDRAKVKRMVEEMFTHFPRLAERAKAQAGYLSGGEQQMLAIARALMTEPKLILLDEPSLGLAPFLVDEIFDIVRRINAVSGVAILLVEQNAVAALDLVETAYLIDQGRIVMSGTAAALAANPDIQDAYLGGAQKVDYHAVKHYRRRKRWLA
ncbi:ABC transporter ATP-binding protein [Azorhizobium oxalatiphilum]|uniref:ABC transporter ATP-binding protein n=1 Tax=Azorhizobium oxalatiphilum TaxID=980631 RepID=A0A917BN34_9HYPH|nr:ABC transporter ATP-binding protein [Azorhizobium oxalatiphilum]GGF52504.1 ABC transporter ATP-binding protein [Azorhizobium oxalatiphilum]